MDPPSAPPFSATATVTSPNATYPDSVSSSPRSRHADSWDDHLSLSSGVNGGPGSKLRLMCSYNGHIVPRPHDKSLCYVGGETRIFVADRHSSLCDLASRLSKSLLNGKSFTLKYQIPNEDLDSLISVSTDEDFENMIEEYDRLAAAASAGNKSSRLRLFLFPGKPDSGSSFGSFLDNSSKSEDWFLNILNGSESGSVNCSMGPDDDVLIAGDGKPSVRGTADEKPDSVKGNKQDVHSVPDSPIKETTSSFGSVSSSPSLGNLPPIRVHVEERKAVGEAGIEDKFSQMSLQKQNDGNAFFALPSAVGGVGGGNSGEYLNRVFSDDVPSQLQWKPAGGVDLISSDSVSSDNTTTNQLARAILNQDPGHVQNPHGNSRVPHHSVDPNSRLQLQQGQDSGYLFPSQFDQQNHQYASQQQQQQEFVPFNPQQQQEFVQFNPQQQQEFVQFNPQQQQQQQPQPQPQPQQQQQQQQQQQFVPFNPQQQHQQQFVQSGTHYIHHNPTGAVPMTSFLPVYPPQQQSIHFQNPNDQNHPIFYMPSSQAQAYNMPIQQPNYNETVTSLSSSRSAQTPPLSKPDMPTTVYRTTTVPSSQHQAQYAGFSQIHHSSQSASPALPANSNYIYELPDPSHTQVFYSSPQLAAQYQNMKLAPPMVFPDSAAQFQADNVKPKIRTSQP